MVLNGTHYHEQTPERVARLLEQARLERKRVRLYYGDTQTGRYWLDENDVTGRLGRSTGSKKIPILLASPRSTGGPGILDHCLVALQVEGKWVYRHPRFEPPMCYVTHEHLPEGYKVGVDIADEHGKLTRHANFKTEDQATRWIAFMRGERKTK